MPEIRFGCLPTAIGSMPHSDPREACEQVVHYLKDIPVWPQLPHRSPRENMYAQFSQGFPGAVLRDERLYVDRSRDLSQPLEGLYRAYLQNDPTPFPISPEYAAGLHHFLNLGIRPLAVKGQVTGPVSWGLTVADQEGRAVLYDDTLADAVAKLLRLKAAWQERELQRISPNTIIFVDEPYLASFGSAFVPLSREKVVALLEEVFGGIKGLKGVHCCGNTDWSVLLGTSTNIVHFDAYNYAQSLSLYPAEVKTFLGRGGTVSWGIVPNEEKALSQESVSSLQDRLEEAMAPLARQGIPLAQLREQALLAPCCGLASLSLAGAARALELLAQLSSQLRKRL